jgi:2-hydroxychromene-2-carboxylate isomerase
VELQRYSEFLHAPLNLKPKYFPVNGDDAARLIVAVDLHDGTEAALKITGAILAAVWAQERHIDDEKVLAELLSRAGPEPRAAGAVAQPGGARTLRRQHPASHRRRRVRRAQLCDRR